ncbi:hypothetical protein [Elizabethkingia meningoseptica]|uniref:hypothetical protein n=1 Tax=Elizabethkingia meningoseptica TaxID=238 RepID=UPI0023B06A2E|nr:hypothetical protein [Elizabethkingia meningoseptica]MDE5526641.1 hypothetical protein [Elizabethkingia meningoseptica]
MEAKEKIIAYITKYALTKGIIEKECLLTSNDMIRTTDEYPQYFHVNEWFASKEDAIERAEQMRIKKLQSLNKQVNKLTNLKFK